MSKSTSNVVAFADRSIEKDPLTELIRRGAQALLNQAVEIGLEERMAEFFWASIARWSPSRGSQRLPS